MRNKSIKKLREKVGARTDAEIEAYEKDLKKFEEVYRKAYDTKLTRELIKEANTTKALIASKHRTRQNKAFSL